MKNTIKCPKCGHEFSASEGLMAHLKEEASQEVEKKVRAEVENEKSLELQDLKKALQEKDGKINDFREKELKLLGDKRKLEDEKKDLGLEVQRKLDEGRGQIEEKAYEKANEDHKFKVLEKEKLIDDLKKSLEDAQRKVQQGSMQSQGEVRELDLQETLGKLFPTDDISEVKKGELGGDVRQIVRTPIGTECGMMLWERKRTKAWQEDWVKKLKEDMRRDKALLGIIVTEVLPKDFKKEIGERNGIWIVTAGFVEPLARLLRQNLYDVAKGKAITLNKQGKAEELYDFVTGQDFIQQVERMVEIYLEMRSQITKERVLSEKLWKQREMQVDGLLKGISGMYGGMQLIAGTALPQVRSLEAPEEDGSK